MPVVAEIVADLVPVLPDARLSSEYKTKPGPAEKLKREVKPLLGLDHVAPSLEQKNASMVLLEAARVMAGAVCTLPERAVDIVPTVS